MKLYSINDLLKMMPVDTVKLKELEAAVEESGCYRQIGRSMILTEGDIHDFLARVSARRIQPRTPARDADGLLVVLREERVGADSLMFLGWSPAGQELDLMDRVQLGYPARLRVHATVRMTYGVADEFRVKHIKARAMGLWFAPSDELANALDAIIEAEEKEIGNE